MIYTVGHSSHPVEYFVSLLRQHGVTMLVDVRSRPRSKYVPQFNAEPLKDALADAGVMYASGGRQLGGKPYGRQFYNANGSVSYEAVAASADFKDGIRWLVVAASELHRQVAIMCSEENPTKCHRRLLVTPAIVEHGIEVLHVRGDGRTQRDDELPAVRTKQLGLF